MVRKSALLLNCVLSLLQFYGCNNAEKHSATYATQQPPPFFKSKVILTLGKKTITGDRYTRVATNERDTIELTASPHSVDYLLLIPPGNFYSLSGSHSSVFLGPGTSLLISDRPGTNKYNFHLLSGELNFESKSTDSFKISTDHFMISGSALTTVNLDTYSNKAMISIAVTTGKAEIKGQDFSISVIPNELFTYNTNKRTYNVITCDGEEQSDWTRGWIRGPNLAIILMKICRWYSLRLDCGDVNLTQLTGRLAFNWQTHRLDDFIVSVGKAFPVKIDIKEKVMIVRGTLQSKPISN